METKLPDLSPLIDFIKKGGTLLLSVILAVASMAFIYHLVRLGFQIWGNSAEGDENTRKKAINHFVLSVIAFILIASASTIAGVFAAIFISNG